MSDDPLKKQLWQHRSVDETRAMYSTWAATYDADVTGSGYATPTRIAALLAASVPASTAPILDFGCGTGLSGLALHNAGFETIDGCDITAQMLAKAQETRVYRRLWLSQAAAAPPTADYAAVCAIGVISLGAAPPETLDTLVVSSQRGGLIALSFNDPTLEDGTYDAHLDRIIAAGQVEIVARHHGPHLTEKQMGSDVILLRVL
jgi:predicted TPR repeat methyltransferase